VSSSVRKNLFGFKPRNNINNPGDETKNVHEKNAFGPRSNINTPGREMVQGIRPLSLIFQEVS